jgi:hypothetical protein
MRKKNYHFRALAVKDSDHQRFCKLAKRYRLKHYQLFHVLLSEHLDNFKEKKEKIDPNEIDDIDRKIFKEFDKLKR